MKSAAIPANEPLRLKTLVDFQVLDTDAELCFDEITELASVICDTPIALISLVDENRQWFKSRVGLAATETPRELAFCAHAILQDDVFEVEDAQKDERFHDNPLVTSGPKIRFYAGAPLKATNGHAVGTLCTISDKPMALTASQKKALVTLSHQVIAQLELRLKLQELHKANQAKDEFLSSISHELRTPLTAISGFSEILLDNPDVQALPEEPFEYLKNIEFSSHQLLSLVNSVLDLEKINAGKMELLPAPTSLSQLFSDVTKMVGVKAKQAGVNLNLDIDTSLKGKYYSVDKTKLAQIIINILNNAVKFTETGKTVSASFVITSDKLRITIADQGVGISAAELPLLFNKYKQVGKHKKEGTGLGLCITKGLVELMGGNIKLDSHEGVGTTVIVELPVKQTNDIHTQGNLEKALVANFNVVVVEDNPLNQVLIKAILSQLNCSCTLFDSAEALLAFHNLSDFDVFFLDINLPGISGIELLELLNQKGLKQPKIAVTADIFNSKTIADLFDAVVTKPFSRQNIIDVLTLGINKPS